MRRSKSSKTWLKEHFSDAYVKQAQKDGYRSRAIYKLIEIDEKEKLLYPGITVIDLGASPGSWTQYVSRKIDGRGNIIALDILPMDALADVTFIQGDFQEEKIFKKLLSHIPKDGVDLILSDMAPNMSGNPEIDIPKAMALAELALSLCTQVLKKNGSLLIKLFHGEGFDQLIRNTRLRFSKVVVKKPKASRSRSRETYMLAKGYKMG